MLQDESASAQERADEVARLSQRDVLTRFLEPPRSAWLCFYRSYPLGEEGEARYCALLPPPLVPKALEQPAWDLLVGDGVPGVTVSYEDGNELAQYERFSGHEIEPLVHSRSFHGVAAPYQEINEEFRLYFNLWQDGTTGNLFAILDDGNRESVVEFRADGVFAAAKYINTFISVKQITLAFYVESRRHSRLELLDDDVGAIRTSHTSETAKLTIFGDNFGPPRDDDRVSFSRLLGKKLMFPSDMNTLDVWPYRKSRRYFQDFIIGVDAIGNEVLSTSDPDNLDNHSDENRLQGRYLTPVYFRQDVLQKYYANPDLYDVEDSYIRCAGLWGVSIDNNHEDLVVVWLGDLGRDLPETEQRYWRSYNVPSDSGPSEVYARRQILAQFADPIGEAFLFKDAYAAFANSWRKRYGWDVWIPLRAADKHHLTSLHVPTTSGPKECDEQILSLAKLMVDSLNVPALRRETGITDQNIKSICLLETLILVRSSERDRKRAQVLRVLQSMRSTAVAHRKGDNYQDALRKAGFRSGDGRAMIRRLLVELTALLEWMGRLGDASGTAAQ